jgi:hypothetical protein
MTNPRVSNGHRRRQLRARILATETVCGICGQDVDKTLHYLDPMAPEIDEILPVSFGGNPTARDNTRLVHRLCNQRRGNGTREQRPITGPIATSRQW